MNLQKRESSVDLIFKNTDYWEGFEFTFCGEKHKFVSSLLVGDSLGHIIDELYYMCIEIIDESHNGFPLKTAHNNPDDTNQITDLYAYLRFDPEGEDTYLSLHRDIYKNNDFSIDVDIEYFNEEKFRYKVSYFDLCYATAKAATKVIKERGFTGFHYDTESDRIDIHHFLNVKHLGIFKKPLSPYHDKDYHTKHTETASLEDEIELLMFDM